MSQGWKLACLAIVFNKQWNCLFHVIPISQESENKNNYSRLEDFFLNQRNECYNHYTSCKLTRLALQLDQLYATFLGILLKGKEIKSGGGGKLNPLREMKVWKITPIQTKVRNNTSRFTNRSQSVSCQTIIIPISLPESMGNSEVYTRHGLKH